MFEVNEHTTWAIMAYEGLADAGYKITEWFHDSEEAKEAWREFKREVVANSHHYKSVIDSRFSVTVLKADGSMVTYAIETWH